MSRYVRVTFRPAGALRSRTVILRDPIETKVLGGHTVLAGREVDREGSPLERRHVISTTLVSAQVELELDRHYGELVPRAVAVEAHGPYVLGRQEADEEVRPSGAPDELNARIMRLLDEAERTEGGPRLDEIMDEVEKLDAELEYAQRVAR